MADKHVIQLMNAMNYVDHGKTAYWRIRAGTSDRDTSHAISAILAIKLRMAGKQVDYETPWGVPRGIMIWTSCSNGWIVSANNW